MIELKNVCKTFQSVTAVDKISFAADKGKIFGLLGPNGAGKSTTIRMIMNILAPDTGQILFDGTPITESDKDRIGYLPEERGLYKKVTVNNVLTYFASLKSADKNDAQKKIDYWLDRFSLTKWKDSKISELSKGMSQKVQFIGTIAHDPEIIILDEPFSGLDPVSADLLNESIMDLGKAGKTILFSTHIMDHAEKICDSVFILNNGTEVLSGPVEQVKDRYGRNTIALDFSGDGSFIREVEGVKNIITYPRFMEIEMKVGADPDQILQRITGKVKIRRFEVMTPSLHKIFIDSVKNVQAGGTDE